MYYRILPTNVRSMPIGCSAEEFTAEYRLCMEDPRRSTNKLNKQIEPFVVHWEQMINVSNYPKDINYITLCKLLHAHGDPIDILSAYKDQIKQTTSVKEELEMLFFERLRNLRYFPKHAAPAMAEYVIALDFRNYLKDRIVSATKAPIDTPVEELSFTTLLTTDNYPDYLLLKNLGIDAWQNYLLMLILMGKSSAGISSISHVPRKTFSNEEHDIWHRLKTKWQAP